MLFFFCFFRSPAAMEEKTCVILQKFSFNETEIDYMRHQVSPAV